MKNRNSSLSKSFQIYAWLHPFEVDTAEIRFFFAWITHYSRTEGRPLRLWLMVQEKAEGTICTMHMGSHHPWTRKEAHGGGYLQQWRCSSKAHGANDFNNWGADPAPKRAVTTTEQIGGLTQHPVEVQVTIPISLCVCVCVCVCVSVRTCVR